MVFKFILVLKAVYLLMTTKKKPKTGKKRSYKRMLKISLSKQKKEKKSKKLSTGNMRKKIKLGPHIQR